MSRPATLARAAVAACSLCLPASRSDAQGCLPPPAGLIDWWPADGSFEDIVGGNDLEPTGVVFLPGIVGSAFWFDGAAYGRVAQYPAPAGRLSGEAWVWPQSTPFWASIAKNWGSASGSQFHFGVDGSSGRLSIYVVEADGTQIGPVLDSQPLALAAWSHVAFVADGARLRLYRDGAEVGSAATYDGTLRSTLPCIGVGAKLAEACDAPSGLFPGYWHGLIDELSLYGRALAAEEIEAIFAAGPAGKCPVLLRDGFESGDTSAWSATVP